MKKFNKSVFKYSFIGTHVGLIPGDYDCEIVKQEVKHNRKGSLETIVTLRVLRETKKEA